MFGEEHRIIINSAKFSYKNPTLRNSFRFDLMNIFNLVVLHRDKDTTQMIKYLEMGSELDDDESILALANYYYDNDDIRFSSINYNPDIHNSLSICV